MEILRLLRRPIRWTKTGTVLLSGFLLIILLIGYIWWPLLKEYLSYIDPDFPIWGQIDWLLIGNFLVMSILIMVNADWKRDIPFLLIGMAGGYIIEAWGTRAGLWTYYTNEKPPLWIIPAWPIAALSVNRLHNIIEKMFDDEKAAWVNWVYWFMFIVFYGLLLDFVWQTFLHPLTIFSLLMCAAVIFTVKDKRSALMIFIVGSALGYFLERWGTTRLCWTYYTGGTPPFFTVLAHGMASVAVWWVFQWSIKLTSYLHDQTTTDILASDAN